jgi:solute carrier family 8 (sodium/calcium exchanger)
VNLEVPKIDKIAGDKVFDEEEKQEDEEESEEECDLIFKVRLDKPEPAGVKISKRNICLVSICNGHHHEKEDDDHAKLIEYFLNNQNPSWMQQFKNAVMLGPQIDEDNMVLEDITLAEGLGHFIAIGWKVFFSLVPPPHYYGGYPCFVVALAMIGLVTAVVGEVATVLGCCINLKESVTAITLVALGTSLPDTFASMTAARNA